MQQLPPAENYFDRYTNLVSEKDLNKAFKKQDKVLKRFMKKISEKKSVHAYAEGKWSLKEVLQHLIDCERIFAYRALVIARKDTVNLPGFEENDYAANSLANKRTWASLCEEMKALRSSTKLMFASFDKDMLAATGTFNNNPGKTETLGFIIAGHTYHHIKIAEERYL